ncbi:hypothetical protein HID58_041860, partial [Brassica napus]
RVSSLLVKPPRIPDQKINSSERDTCHLIQSAPFHLLFGPNVMLKGPIRPYHKRVDVIIVTCASPSLPLSEIAIVKNLLLGFSRHRMPSSSRIP